MIVIGAFALAAVSCTFGFVAAAVLSDAGRADLEFENEILRQRLDEKHRWTYPETDR